jgi:hypothetical protein
MIITMRIIFILVVVTFIVLSCKSDSNKRAVDLNELEQVQSRNEDEESLLASTREALYATELIELADCSDINCVQLFMKDRSTEFFHARKGEFAAKHRTAIKDTAGNELIMPVSTFYVDVNPQASWRAAHTIHKIEVGNKLLEEFHKLGFMLVDSGHFVGIKSIQQRFTSAQFPGRSLYITSTFAPWWKKGLYNTNVTWPCFVFEVYKD